MPVQKHCEHGAKVPMFSGMTQFLMRGVVTCVLVWSACAEANWPQFRGPNGDGHSDAKGLPVTWSETENVRWKTPVHGKAWSSPVIWGTQVWMTTAPEEG